VSQVDELFDSFNGTQINTGAKPLKCAISEESPHSTYWSKAYQLYGKQSTAKSPQQRHYNQNRRHPNKTSLDPKVSGNHAGQPTQI
jgi:hypothetical protein